MNKLLAVNMIIVWLSTVFTQSCGPQMPNITKPTPGGTAFTGSNQLDGLRQDLCKDAGGDSDGDELCDDDELELGPDCQFTEDCEEPGIPDGDSKKHFFKNPWNVALVTVAGAALVGTGIWQETKGNINVIPLAATKKRLITATGRQLDFDMGDYQDATTNVITQRRPDHKPFLTVVGKATTSEPIKIADYKFGNDIMVCIRTGIGLPSIDQPIDGTNKIAKVALTTAPLANGLGNAFYKELDESAFRQMCHDHNTGGYWIGIALNGTFRASRYLVKSMNPEALGFGQRILASNAVARQATIQFYTLTNPTASLKFVENERPDITSELFTLSTGLAALPSEITCNNDCQMRRVLQLPVPGENMEAIRTATDTLLTWGPSS